MVRSYNPWTILNFHTLIIFSVIDQQVDFVNKKQFHIVQECKFNSCCQKEQQRKYHQGMHVQEGVGAIAPQ